MGDPELEEIHEFHYLFLSQIALKLILELPLGLQIDDLNV